MDDLEVLIDKPNRGLNKPNVEDLVLRAGGTTISNKEMFLSGNRLVIVNNVDKNKKLENERQKRKLAETSLEKTSP